MNGTFLLWDFERVPWGLLNEEVHSDAIENQKTRNLPAQPIVMKAVSNTGHSSPFRCCWSEGLIIHPCHPSLIIHPSHPYLIFHPSHLSLHLHPLPLNAPPPPTFISSSCLSPLLPHLPYCLSPLPQLVRRKTKDCQRAWEEFWEEHFAKREEHRNPGEQ